MKTINEIQALADETIVFCESTGLTTEPTLELARAVKKLIRMNELLKEQRDFEYNRAPGYATALEMYDQELTKIWEEE